MKLRNKRTREIVEPTSVEWVADDEITFAYTTADDCGKALSYHSLADFNEEWEDYKPAEPLIKDEKIRKAVRAWANAQGLTELYLASNGYEIYGGIDDWVMQFKGEPFPFADKNEVYTIAELCGEEE